MSEIRKCLNPKCEKQIDTSLKYCSECGVLQSETPTKILTTSDIKGLFEENGFQYLINKEIEKAVSSYYTSKIIPVLGVISLIGAVAFGLQYNELGKEIDNLKTTANKISEDSKKKSDQADGEISKIRDLIIAIKGEALGGKIEAEKTKVDAEKVKVETEGIVNSKISTLDSYVTKAEKAAETANQKSTAANTAYTNANSAATNANIAYTNANSAATRANTAYTNADSAATNAGTAYTTANQAATNADAAATRIEKKDKEISELSNAVFEKTGQLQTLQELSNAFIKLKATETVVLPQMGKISVILPNISAKKNLSVTDFITIEFEVGDIKKDGVDMWYLVKDRSSTKQFLAHLQPIKSDGTDPNGALCITGTPFQVKVGFVNRTRGNDFIIFRIQPSQQCP